jgi:hypothetical protein
VVLREQFQQLAEAWMSLMPAALAHAGDRTLVETVASKLDADFPEDTMIQRHWLPCIRAAMAIADEDAAAALRALAPAQSMELSLCTPFEGGFMLPTHLRGLAHLAAGKREEATREFEKIKRPGLVKNYITYPLAVKAEESGFGGDAITQRPQVQTALHEPRTRVALHLVYEKLSKTSCDLAARD